MKDHRAIVQQVHATGRFKLGTHEENGKFTREVAFRIYQIDPEYGELLKSAGRTHVTDRLGRRVAVDAILHKPTGRSVDIIGSSDDPTRAKPSWTVDIPRYTADDWAAPAGLGDVIEPPKPPVEPPAPPVDLEPLKREIEALKTANALLKASLEAIRIRLDALESKPEPAFAQLEVVGQTSRVWGHSHEIHLPATKR